MIELFEKKDERELYEKLIIVEETVNNLIKSKDYKKVLTLLSTFDNEIENFFENVVINVADKNIKTNHIFCYSTGLGPLLLCTFGGDVCK